MYIYMYINIPWKDAYDILYTTQRCIWCYILWKDIFHIPYNYMLWKDVFHIPYNYMLWKDVFHNPYISYGRMYFTICIYAMEGCISQSVLYAMEGCISQSVYILWKDVFYIPYISYGRMYLTLGTSMSSSCSSSQQISNTRPRTWRPIFFFVLCSTSSLRLEKHTRYYHSRILLTFPHAENSCEINPSHMVFMICNLAQCI